MPVRMPLAAWLGLPWADAARAGLTAAICAIIAVLVGFFGTFADRWLVVHVVSIGHATLAAFALGFGYRPACVKGAASRRGAWIAAGAVAGLIGGGLVGLLAVVWQSVNLRWVFVAVTPAVLRHLTFGLGPPQALAALGAAGAGLGAAGGALASLPPAARRAVLWALGAVTVFGLFQELARTLAIGAWAYSYDGLLPAGATAAAGFGAVAALLREWVERDGQHRIGALPRAWRRAGTVLGIAALLLVPAVTNDFIAEVAMLVGLYVLMGMGLNIELGLAGLVDLGFVAFFAVGAYAVALLTAASPLALAHLTFWEALPAAVGVAAVAGFLFGLPVLRVRGDYLAIATLGLGEIVRVLVVSDMLKPLLGGAQGIVEIPKPTLAGIVLASPTRLFYLTAAMAGLAAYFAWRLQYSSLGRKWLAVREDEDVAQALGINLVQVKLSAYTLGAGFAGLAGGIFAAMLGSVFPQSFQLVVSVNVLAVLVVGGIGSLPGVLVGAAALIGVPEVLRDLGEFRYLIYGITVIAVVRLKPEGLRPAAVRRREGG